MRAMELFHFRAPGGNFGDDLNTWFWDEMLPGWQDILPGHLLVGVGTLVNDLMPRGVPKVILGSGVGYGSGLPDARLFAECRVVAVRGPRSAAALGLPASVGILDPAAMIPTFERFRSRGRGRGVLVIPHHESLRRLNWRAICAMAGTSFLSPCRDSEEVIRRIAGAGLVVTESLHGAIIADAFGVPWRAVSVSARFHRAKWQDWADSLGIDLDLAALLPVAEAGAARVAGQTGFAHRAARKARALWEAQTAVRRLRRLAADGGQLSDRAALGAARDAYRARLAQAFGDERPTIAALA
jgi:succinoglycan biosynthesis protein ExoV